LPRFDLLPPFQEQRDFRFSADQWCQFSGHSHIKTPPGSTLLEDVVYVDGLRDTSEYLGSPVLALEIALNESVGDSTDHERIGLRQSLYPCSNVGRCSQGELLVSPTTAHLSHYDQSSVHAYTQSEWNPFFVLETALEGSHRIENT
jgi:hypothetical protein